MRFSKPHAKPGCTSLNSSSYAVEVNWVGISLHMLLLLQTCTYIDIEVCIWNTHSGQRESYSRAGLLRGLYWIPSRESLITQCLILLVIFLGQKLHFTFTARMPHTHFKLSEIYSEL